MATRWASARRSASAPRKCTPGAPWASASCAATSGWCGARARSGRLQTLLGTGVVVAVSASQGHTMSKVNREAIRLIAGVGVEGDAHAGATVKHRSRVAKDATRPNLRQVHL